MVGCENRSPLAVAREHFSAPVFSSSLSRDCTIAPPRVILFCCPRSGGRSRVSLIFRRPRVGRGCGGSWSSSPRRHASRMVTRQSWGVRCRKRWIAWSVSPTRPSSSRTIRASRSLVSYFVSWGCRDAISDHHRHELDRERGGDEERCDNHRPPDDNPAGGCHRVVSSRFRRSRSAYSLGWTRWPSIRIRSSRTPASRAE